MTTRSSRALGHTRRGILAAAPVALLGAAAEGTPILTAEGARA